MVSGLSYHIAHCATPLYFSSKKTKKKKDACCKRYKKKGKLPCKNCPKA
jgi:hypothetical protein